MSCGLGLVPLLAAADRFYPTHLFSQFTIYSTNVYPATPTESLASLEPHRGIIILEGVICPLLPRPSPVPGPSW